jgi:hypothetical protein
MNNCNKPFIGIPLTNEKYLFNITKINNNIKKNESFVDIICNFLLEEF